MTTWAEARVVRDRRERLFRPGDRVELVRLAPSAFDDSGELPAGLRGTVYALAGRVCDDAGSLHVRWDNGSTLSAAAGDEVRPAPPPADAADGHADV